VEERREQRAKYVGASNVLSFSKIPQISVIRVISGKGFPSYNS
jgi:hypothetical protein